MTTALGHINVVLEFGADPSGVADSTAAIQAAIDKAIYNGSSAGSAGTKTVVYLPAGTYKTTGPIHMGYGEGFHSVLLQGDSASYRGQNTFNGTVINATGSTAPAICVSGGRMCGIRDMTILGPNQSWVSSHNLGKTNPTLDDTVAANWIDSGFAAASSSQYAPLAGIAVDPYAGTRPGTHYPDVTYPGFMANTQYGKNFSSHTDIENVYIAGFVAGIVVQPCDADGNGDFTRIIRCFMEKCVYGVSVGNTQSRGVTITDPHFAQCFCALTSNKHGRLNGKYGSTVSGMSTEETMYWFQFGEMSYVGPLVFQSCYGEGMWKIGSVGANTSNELSLRFDNCQFAFSSQTIARGVPASVLDVGADNIHVAFDGGEMQVFDSVIGIDANGNCLDINGLSMRCQSARTNPYEKFCHNALCGGLATKKLDNGSINGRRRLKFRQYNVDTGAFSGLGTVLAGGTWQSSRVYPLPVYAENASAISDVRDGGTYVPRKIWTIDKSAAISNVTLVNRTLQFDWTGKSAAEFAKRGPSTGDVIFDDRTRTIFFVRSLSGVTVIAEAQNNFKSTDAGVTYTFLTAFDNLLGNFYVGTGRMYMPAQYLRGDVGTGAATITNCGRDDGVNTFVTTEITTDDYLYVDELHDVVFPVASAKVAVVVAATITLGANANYNATKKRFPFWMRPGPANV